MTAADQVLRARAVVADALGLSVDDVPADASMETLDDWDSLQHLHVIMAIEAEGGVRLSTSAAPEMDSVERIAAHLADVAGGGGR